MLPTRNYKEPLFSFLIPEIPAESTACCGFILSFVPFVFRKKEVRIKTGTKGMIKNKRKVFMEVKF
jgi:hypothetical protein